MVGENLKIFMSEMPENIANYQKSDFPPGWNLKIQIPHQNPSSPGTLKSDFPPQTEPFGKSQFLPKILGRNDTMHLEGSNSLNMQFWLNNGHFLAPFIVSLRGEKVLTF